MAFTENRLNDKPKRFMTHRPKTIHKRNRRRIQVVKAIL